MLMLNKISESESESIGSIHICVFVWLGYWNYVSQLPHVGDYVFVKSSCVHAREESESKRAYVL